MIRSFAIFVLLITFGATMLSCIARREAVSPEADIDRLVGWMTGSYSSRHQAETDSSYIDIRLEMVQIWPDRDDGHWLYVEQAAASNLERPYRQRIYHVTQPQDSVFASTVYEFEEPLRMAGAWRIPQDFDLLTPDSLSEKVGCTIFLTLEGDSAFVGGTHERDCLSGHRGAAYATSEVRITATYLYSWDQGWDAIDAQVWGAELGGYRFLRLSEE